METAAAILIVEDDALYATVLAEQLTVAGLSPVVAGDLEAAAAQLDRHVFDAAIIDLHLPGTDGRLPESLLLQLGNTPAILVTGTPTLDSALGSIQQRVFAYRVKPFEMTPFVETVRQAVVYGRLRGRLTDMRRRYQMLDEQVHALHTLIDGGDRDVNQSLADYLRLLLGGSAESLMEALDILATLERGALAQPVRRLSRHPEAEMFKTAVQEAVEVLEKTKNSFRSKELADLRRRLELALHVAGDDRRSP